MCDIKSPKIKIFGIGGAGCTNVNLLLEKPLKDVDYYVVDSNKEVLRLSECPNKIEVTSEFSLARKILIVMNLGMKHLNELLDEAINS